MASSIHIAIVCGHFLPEMGYIEVELARTLARMGHRVEVVTSDVVPAYVRSKVSGLLKAGTQEIDGYTLHRLSKMASLGQIVICRGVRNKVEEIAPQLVITVGMGKRFPLPILRKDRPFRLTTLLGDNHAGYARKRSFADRILKEGVYQKAVETSDTILSYTPESKGIVSLMLNDKLKEVLEIKCREISLGYDEELFYYEARIRAQMRQKYAVSEQDSVAITATRCSPEKRLDELLKKIDSEIGSGALHSYHLIGLAEDATSEQLRKIHGQLKNAERIHLHEMLPTEALLPFFHLADIGIWTRAAISLFQALGTGLPLILPRAKSMDHVLQKGEGVRAEIEEIELKKIFAQISSDRKAIADSAAKRFSNTHVAGEVLRLSGL